MPLQEVHTGFTFNFDGSKLSAIERGVKRTTKNLGHIGERTAAFQSQMGGVLQRARGIIGAYLGFRAVRSITTGYAQAADAVAKFSNGLGINAQKYQALTHAGQLNGLTLEEMNVALPNLAKNAGNAADGSKSMADAFRRAGVEFKAGKALGDPIDLLHAFADGLKDVNDPIRRTQILMNTFGRSGKKMGVLMSQGSEGIKKAMAEAQKLGIVLSDKDLKAAEQFNDEMLRVKSIMIGVRNAIATRVVPALTRLLTRFKEWWLEGRNAEHAMRALKVTAILVGIVIGRMIGGAVIKQISIFVRGILAAASAIRTMGVAASITALKVLAIFAAIALVVLLIEDLIYFAQGKDSLIGRILGDSSIATTLRNALLNFWKQVKQSWSEMRPKLLEAWEALKPVLEKVGKLLKPIIGMAFKSAIASLIGLLYLLTFSLEQVSGSMSVMRSIFAKAGEAIAWLADWLTEKWEDFSDNVGGSFEDLEVDIKKLAALFGISLGGSASTVSRAWDTATAGIRKALGVLRAAVKEAKGWLDKLTGGGASAAVSTAENFIGRLTGRTGTKIGKAVTGQAGDVGAMGTMAAQLALNQPPALIGVPAGMGFGIGIAPQTVNNSMAPGAIQVTVQGGEPGAVVTAIRAGLKKQLAKTFTDASRDIKPPPRGQR
jgi:hypothetical protein